MAYTPCPVILEWAGATDELPRALGAGRRHFRHFEPGKDLGSVRRGEGLVTVERLSRVPHVNHLISCLVEERPAIGVKNHAIVFTQDEEMILLVGDFGSMFVLVD
jgi:hypothetical protein